MSGSTSSTPSSANTSHKAFTACSGCTHGTGQNCEELDEQMPAACVSWTDADRFCREVRRGRLPSEPEWELAARGRELFKYPWGNEDDPQKVVCDVREMPCKLDRPDDDVSPFGVLGMGYSVAEWTRTCFDTPKCSSMIVAGRSFRDVPRLDLVFGRDAEFIDYGQRIDIGFRCVADPR